MLRWKTAQVYLLALACILHRQQHVEAAYSPAVVRIDTGSSNGPFTDAGGNVWSSDTNNSGGVWGVLPSLHLLMSFLARTTPAPSLQHPNKFHDLCRKQRVSKHVNSYRQHGGQPGSCVPKYPHSTLFRICFWPGRWSCARRNIYSKSPANARIR